MRRMIAFLTGFAVVAVAAMAFGSVKNGIEPRERFGDLPESPYWVVPASEKDPLTSPGLEMEKEVEEVQSTGLPAMTTPVTEPTDLTPPFLQILHPLDGQIFTQKEVVFEGTTEVGARVFAGKYEADVSSDGTWRIVLFLSAGHNLATFVAKDAAGNASEARVSPVLEVPTLEVADKEQEHEEEFKTEFSAHQQYGKCSENPPYDVFYGTGRPGSKISVVSEFGDGVTEANDAGHWEIKVTFPESPVGTTFLVKVKDSDGHSQAFEFTRTA